MSEQEARIIPRRAVVSWVLYDLANTIFSMGVVSLYFSLYVRETVGADRADSVYGLITAVSMGIIFFISPLLGAMTDRARRRMPFLIASTLACVGFTALLARSGFTTTAILFVLANIAYQAGLQFYDAMLPDVSTEENRGRIGGIGVGIGYLGSYVAVGLGLDAVFGSDDKPFLFLVIACCFLIFAIPCFLFVKQRPNPNPRPVFDLKMIRDSASETIRTLKSGSQYPGLVRFLVGRAFYTDAINTVIAVMALYTVNVAIGTGLTQEQGEEQAKLILLCAITFAVIGGFVWGMLADRVGPKRTLDYVLRCWMLIFAAFSVVGIVGLPIVTLYVVACAAGFSMGGMMAADRPLMLRLTPPSRIGEFYGLYGMVSRFSAVTGPLFWSGVTYLTITRGGMVPRVGQGIAAITLLAMVVISYLVLRPVTDERRNWADISLP